MVNTIHSTEQFFERFPRLFHVFNRTQSFVQMGEIRFLTVPRLASRNIPSTFLHAYYLVVCWECRWVSLQFLFPDFAQRFFYSLVILDIQKGIRRNKVKVTCTFTDYIHRNMQCTYICTRSCKYIIRPLCTRNVRTMYNHSTHACVHANVRTVDHILYMHAKP